MGLGATFTPLAESPLTVVFLGGVLKLSCLGLVGDATVVVRPEDGE